MLTPSLVMVGAPHFFSRTTLRPLGPNVTLTASASWFIPRSRPRRASSLKAISFGISQRFLLAWIQLWRIGWLPATDGQCGPGGPFPPALLTSAQPVRCGGTLNPRVPASCLALAPLECKRARRSPSLPGRPDRYLLPMTDPRRPIRLSEKASTDRSDLHALLDTTRVGHFALVADD